MTYMRQVLQERSIYFSETSKVTNMFKGLSVKDMKLLTQIAVQDPKAAELKRLIVKADMLLKSNGADNPVTKEEKLVSYMLAMMRIFADAQYGVTLAFNGYASSFIYTAAGGSLGAAFVYLLPVILSTFIFVVANRQLRKTINEKERIQNRHRAKKLLAGLKKLEKKVPEKEKVKIRKQIDKMEKSLKEN